MRNNADSWNLAVDEERNYITLFLYSWCLQTYPNQSLEGPQVVGYFINFQDLIDEINGGIGYFGETDCLDARCLRQFNLEQLNAQA